MTARLQVDYANYLLEFPWDGYITQTFRKRRNDAFNAALAWWRCMESKLGWTMAYTAVEYHRLGGVHLHSLVANEAIDWTNKIQAGREVVHRLATTKKYSDKAFGFTACSTAKNLATVSLYCSKYVTKSQGEYYFFGDWDMHGLTHTGIMESNRW